MTNGMTMQGAPPPYPQSPTLEMPIALVVLVANLFIPGLGTIIAGVVGQKKMIGRGVGQFLLIIVFLAGWVWALVTSIQCLTNASRARPAGPAMGAPPMH